MLSLKVTNHRLGESAGGAWRGLGLGGESSLSADEAQEARTQAGADRKLSLRSQGSMLSASGAWSFSCSDF